jgi:NAD(P)-dependent dehydrogenase (short-subunit alcohol dehydrogenase family)
MTGRMASKVVVVTGGSSGIGRAVARRVVAEGAAVVIGARRPAPGRAAVEELRAMGGRAEFVPVDVTVEADCRRVVDVAVDSFGRLDGAFNNAGDVGAGGPLVDVERASFERELAVNLTSVFLCLRAEIAALGQTGLGGSIVNNASIGGVAGIAGMAPYVAAKHGVIGLTRSAALEYAAGGIRVNALVTGNVDTPLYRRLVGVAPDVDVELPAPNPTGRVASVDEIAAYVAFLLSDESRFITGAALAIDGGATAS